MNFFWFSILWLSFWLGFTQISQACDDNKLTATTLDKPELIIIEAEKIRGAELSRRIALRICYTPSEEEMGEEFILIIEGSDHELHYGETIAVMDTHNQAIDSLGIKLEDGWDSSGSISAARPIRYMVQDKKVEGELSIGFVQLLGPPTFPWAGTTREINFFLVKASNRSAVLRRYTLPGVDFRTQDSCQMEHASSIDLGAVSVDGLRNGAVAGPRDFTVSIHCKLNIAKTDFTLKGEDGLGSGKLAQGLLANEKEGKAGGARGVGVQILQQNGDSGWRPVDLSGIKQEGVGSPKTFVYRAGLKSLSGSEEPQAGEVQSRLQLVFSYL
jgi:type 1 fimbria pilin